ncbi:hypothetical protein [Brevundimonas sp. FT23042]|uniref:hypothetical protein n=1 Tax=Brevundimonas sp. FT23042 TaxID=3393749 RepID=UPI003B58A1C7
MRSIILAASAAAVLLAGCATSSPPMEMERPVPLVTVARDGDRWSADFVLPSDSPVWVFTRSALARESGKPWRDGQWSVETPGVVLERRGHFDILRTVDGGAVPRSLRIRMTPKAEDLMADYDPALMFTDGSAAIYSGHFNVFPMGSIEEVEALPMDLNEIHVEAETSRITWRDTAGPVLLQGERRSNPTSEQGGIYVLFGQAELVDSPRLATVIDPGLPAWMGNEIKAFAPRIAGYYAERLGPGQTDKPTIMVSWNGPTPQLRSMGGSVLRGMIIMAFEGDNVVTESTDMRDHARWFIGHESAHFWLGQTVRYEFTREAWITEGGADLMAMRAQAALSPTYDVMTALQEEVDDCATLAVKPVASANQRSEHRAYYACGAVFALAAEAAQKRATGGDWFDFLKGLIDSNRDDGKVNREEWLEALLQVTGDPDVRREIDTLLDEGAPDPAVLIARLFDRTGVAYRLDGGKVKLV